MNGHIRLVKALAHHELWLQKPFDQAHAWVDLILLANDADRVPILRGEAVPLCRGQLAWSLDGLGMRWGWSRTKMTSFMDRLEKDGRIERLSNRRLTIITIVNYDLYQDPVCSDLEPTEMPTEMPTEEPSEVPTEMPTEEPSERLRKEEEGREGRELHTHKRKLMTQGTTEFGVEVPSDFEFYAWVDSWPGEPSMGIDKPGIPRAFADQWMARAIERERHEPFPRNWKRAITFAYRAFFRRGLKVRGGILKLKKTAAEETDMDDLRWRRDRLIDAGEFAAAGELTETILNQT